MSLIKTTKDKPVIVHGHYIYRFDRRSADDGKFWRCVTDGCLGRINTDSNVLKREAARLGLTLNPTTIMSGFEIGLIPAIQQSFPQTRHRGC
jgi:FLYWCH zinc finger domain